MIIFLYFTFWGSLYFFFLMSYEQSLNEHFFYEKTDVFLEHLQIFLSFLSPFSPVTLLFLMKLQANFNNP